MNRQQILVCCVFLTVAFLILEALYKIDYKLSRNKYVVSKDISQPIPEGETSNAVD